MTARRPEFLEQCLALIDERKYPAARESLESVSVEDLNILETNDRLLAEILLAECRAFTGAAKRAIVDCQRLLTELRDGLGHSHYARVCFVLAVAHRQIGECDSAVDYCNVAAYTYLRVSDSAGVSRSFNWLGNIYFNISKFQEAAEAYRRSEEFALDAGVSRAVTVARFNLAKPLALMGDLNKSLDMLEKNAKLMAESGDNVNSMRQALFHSFVLTQLRDSDRARSLLLPLHFRLSALPIREQGCCYEYMGELELCSGNLAEAEKHLLAAIAIGEGASRDESVIGQSRRLLAEVRLAQGDTIETIAECRRALESICKVGERFEEGVVYRILAEAHLARGEQAEARAAFKQSLDILRAIGAKLEWAKTCLSAGETDVFSRRERLAFLAEAERLFGEIGIEYWIDRTRAQLKMVLDDRGEELQARKQQQAASTNGYFITKDPETLELLKIAEKLARKDIAILITGEPGVGKDHLARFLHSISPRRDAPFVPIDLNTIPESLWESELFGYRKGTFTGASGEKTGLLESASGGTVFLNEIGNLPLSLQPKLLEFLDTRQVRRLGELHASPLDVRFIAATNENLKEASENGRFRQDLYWRLAQSSLHLKPLRERRTDILPLVRRFLTEFGVPVEDLALLDRQLWIDRVCNGQWSGNVRQLRSFIYQLVAIADRPADPEFPEWGARLAEQVDLIKEAPAVAAITRERLVDSLARNGWNQRAAGRELGMSEAWVRRQIRLFGLMRDTEAAAAIASSE